MEHCPNAVGRACAAALHQPRDVVICVVWSPAVLCNLSVFFFAGQYAACRASGIAVCSLDSLSATLSHCLDCVSVPSKTAKPPFGIVEGFENDLGPVSIGVTSSHIVIRVQHGPAEDSICFAENACLPSVPLALVFHFSCLFWYATPPTLPLHRSGGPQNIFVCALLMDQMVEGYRTLLFTCSSLPSGNPSSSVGACAVDF